MNVVTEIALLREEITSWKKEEHSIGLVPTMGFLHEGHLSLVREARTRCDKLVTSIFVNPLQFGANEDLDRYPKTLQRDTQLLEREGVDLLFCPQPAAMYQKGFQTSVTLGEIASNLCGSSRPGHFEGVATVVCKLFNLISPDIAVFGQKDYQQLMIIQQLVEDLNFPVEIIGCPIVREPDGLAMSSRNKYLTDAERKEAVRLYKALIQARQMIEEQGICPSVQVKRSVQDMIEESPLCRVDYVAVVNAQTLSPVERAKQGDIIAVAVFLNKTRLIDNMLL